MARPKRAFRKVRSAFATFLATEAAGGVVLFVAALVAIVWANTLPAYDSVWATTLRIGPAEMDLRHWINDGLMAIFFLVVGLEIKRELILGELRDVKVAAMPVVAAIGGMVGPALVYLAVNSSGGSSAGWAIPMATDIAFVVGAIALLGDRIPSGLKVFLLALAIVDDIGAIAVIAVMFTDSLDARWLVLAVIGVVGVVVLRGLQAPWPAAYLIPGIALWCAAFGAGVHPTLAGVGLGFLIPAKPVAGRDVLDSLERSLHPLSSFVVVPLFALANAGISFGGGTFGKALGSRVFWGVAAGLVVGKGVGIFGASVAAERLRLAKRPDDVDRVDLAGGALLAGIGFTVSLFITPLAFRTDELVGDAKMGVLFGSLVSAAIAVTLFVFQTNWRTARPASHGNATHD